MVFNVQAIYRDGQLQLLESVDSRDGQQVQISIEVPNEREVLKDILGDLITWSNPDDNSEAWVEALSPEIDHAYQGIPPLS